MTASYPESSASLQRTKGRWLTWYHASTPYCGTGIPSSRSCSNSLSLRDAHSAIILISCALYAASM
jgi:hypothetical protein